MLLEYEAVSFLFDVQPLRAQLGWVGWAGDAATFALVAVTAVLALGRAPQESDVELLRRRALPLPRLWAWGTAHLVAAAGFFAVSSRMFGDRLDAVTHPSLLLAAWLSLLAAVVFTAAASALSWPAAAQVARLAARPAGVGLAAGTLAWLAAGATERLWPYLSRLTLEAAALIIGPFAGDELTRDPERLYLGIGDFVVEVSAGCSGLQGMGLIGVLAIAYIVRFHRTLSLPHAVAIVPFGIVGAYLANVFRIAALVVIGAKLSPDVAIGGFHSKSGWLFTCGLALGLLVWVRHSPTFSREVALARRENRPGSVNGQENPTVAYLAPLMLNLGLLLLTGAGVASFDLLGPLRVLVVAIFIAWLPWRRIGLKAWSFSGYPVLLGIVVFVVWLLLVRPDSADASNVIPGLATLSPAGRVVWLSARISARPS